MSIIKEININLSSTLNIMTDRIPYVSVVNSFFNKLKNDMENKMYNYDFYNKNMGELAYAEFIHNTYKNDLLKNIKLSTFHKVHLNEIFLYMSYNYFSKDKKEKEKENYNLNLNSLFNSLIIFKIYLSRTNFEDNSKEGFTKNINIFRNLMNFYTMIFDYSKTGDELDFHFNILKLNVLGDIIFDFIPFTEHISYLCTKLSCLNFDINDQKSVFNFIVRYLVKYILQCHTSKYSIYSIIENIFLKFVDIERENYIEPKSGTETYSDYMYKQMISSYFDNSSDDSDSDSDKKSKHNSSSKITSKIILPDLFIIKNDKIFKQIHKNVKGDELFEKFYKFLTAYTDNDNNLNYYINTNTIDFKYIFNYYKKIPFPEFDNEKTKEEEEEEEEEEDYVLANSPKKSGIQENFNSHVKKEDLFQSGIQENFNSPIKKEDLFQSGIQESFNSPIKKEDLSQSGIQESFNSPIKSDIQKSFISPVKKEDLFQKNTQESFNSPKAKKSKTISDPHKNVVNDENTNNINPYDNIDKWVNEKNVLSWDVDLGISSIGIKRQIISNSIHTSNSHDSKSKILNVSSPPRGKHNVSIGDLNSINNNFY